MTLDLIRKNSFDHVIVAQGSRPVKTLEKALKNEKIDFTAVGDCVAPGKISDAIHCGFLAANKL